MLNLLPTVKLNCFGGHVFTNQGMFEYICICLFKIKLSLTVHKIEVKEKLVITFFWHEES